MNPKRTLAISRRVLQSIRHDKRTLALILIAPMLSMFVFGVAFGSDISHIPVVVVNEDKSGDLGARLLAHLNATALAISNASNEFDARAAVHEGKVWGAIIIPPGFTEDSTATPPPTNVLGQPTGPPTPPRGTNLTLVLDKSNTQIAATITRAAAEALQAALAEKGFKSPIGVVHDDVYGHNAAFLDYFAPGVMCFAIYLFTTLLTLLAFVNERTQGTLSRLLVTPLTEGEVVAGYALAFMTLATAQSTILLGFAILVFHITVVGNVALAFLLTVLLALSALSLGILLSSFAKRELQAVQMIPFIILPTFLLSGIFLPVEALPGWLRPFAYLVPPTWAVEGLRSVLLRGWGLDRMWGDVVAIATFAAVFLLGSVVVLKRARAT
ncbi:MAG: ABC transporter permease [Thermoplasmatota archaeon]